MTKYYTRACNFYYGIFSKQLIKKKLSLPLCGNLNISFDKIEILSRDNKKISSKVIDLKKIKFLPITIKKKILSDIKIITAKEEWKRVKEVIKNFKKKYPKIKLSIDTRKSKIMLDAIRFKADIINDVSCFTFDKKSLINIRGSNVWKVIHHMQGTPQTMQKNPKYNHVLLDIYDFFETKIKKLKKNKYSNNLILDPGIGFGKNLKHNLMLLNKISLFHSLGFPVLIGPSRKKFINQIAKNFDTNERIGGTLSSVLYTLSQGIQIFRVHNVEEVKQGILVFKKLLNQ